MRFLLFFLFPLLAGGGLFFFGVSLGKSLGNKGRLKAAASVAAVVSAARSLAHVDQLEQPAQFGLRKLELEEAISKYDRTR
jgi:hypothetical protein